MGSSKTWDDFENPRWSDEPPPRSVKIDFSCLDAPRPVMDKQGCYVHETGVGALALVRMRDGTYRRREVIEVNGTRYYSYTPLR